MAFYGFFTCNDLTTFVKLSEHLISWNLFSANLKKKNTLSSSQEITF